MMQEDHRGGPQQAEKTPVGGVSGQRLGPVEGGAFYSTAKKD